MASLMFFTVSALVLPWETQPGRDGQMAIYVLFLSCVISILNFTCSPLFLVVTNSYCVPRFSSPTLYLSGVPQPHSATQTPFAFMVSQAGIEYLLFARCSA